ncbi:MAG: hypothetical protein V4692_01300 [Bdellovibrionota bacterium]
MTPKKHEGQILALMIASLGITAAVLSFGNLDSNVLLVQGLAMTHNLIAILFIFSDLSTWKANTTTFVLGIGLSIAFVAALMVSPQIAIWAVLIRVSYGFIHILKDEFHFLKYSRGAQSFSSPFFLISVFVTVSAAILVKTFGIHLESKAALDFAQFSFYAAGLLSLIWLAKGYLQNGLHRSLTEKLYYLYFFGLLLVIGLMSVNAYSNLALLSFALVHHVISWYLVYIHRAHQRRGQIETAKGPRWMRHLKTNPILFMVFIVVAHALYFGGAIYSIKNGWLSESQMILGESFAKNSWSATGQPAFFLLFDVLTYHAFGIIHNTMSWRVWLTAPNQISAISPNERSISVA